MQDFQFGPTRYSVERDDDGNVMLTGPRGATYGLIACRNLDGSKSEWFSAVNCGHASIHSTPFYGTRFRILEDKVEGQTV